MGKLDDRPTCFANSTAPDHGYLDDPVGRALRGRALGDGDHVLHQTHCHGALELLFRQKK